MVNNFVHTYIEGIPYQSPLSSCVLPAILEDLTANLVRIGAHIDAVRTRIDR